MIVHQVFAQINNSEIKNIIVCGNYDVANTLARSIYGPNAIAVECTQYPVSIGDKYIDNTFYFKDGITQVPRQNTAEEDVKVLNTETTELKSSNEDVINTLADMLITICELQLGIISDEI